MKESKHGFFSTFCWFVGFGVVVLLLCLGITLKGVFHFDVVRHSDTPSDWSHSTVVSTSMPPTVAPTQLPSQSPTASIDPMTTSAKASETQSPSKAPTNSPTERQTTDSHSTANYITPTINTQSAKLTKQPTKSSTKALSKPALNGTSATVRPKIPDPSESAQFPETSIDVCNALKHWLEIDCANDPNTLTADLRVEMAKGSFHSLTALFRRLYPEVDDDSFNAAVAMQRELRNASVLNGTDEFEGDIDVVRVIHELDAANLLDTFAYYGHEFGPRKCNCSNERAVHIANANIWLPASCSVPFSARLKQGGYSLVPRNWRIVFIGNSYMGQVSDSLFTRSVVRSEAHMNDLSPTCAEHPLTEYKYRHTGVQQFKLINNFWSCLPTETLLRNVMAGMKVEDVNQIDMIVVNEGNAHIAHFHEECPKHLNETGLERLIDAEEMVQLLKTTMNYTGLALITNYKYFPTKGNFTFHFGQPLYHSITCHATKGDCPEGYGHQCVPGHPDWASEALLTNAYLHFCRQKLAT